MNRTTLATTFAVSGLLLAALLCLGGRHLTDRRREAGALSSTHGEAAQSDATREGPANRSEIGRAGSGRDSQAISKRLRSLLSTGDSAERLHGILALLDNLQSRDFPEILDSLSKMGLGNLSIEYPLVMEEWTRLNPLAAMAWAGDGFARQSAIIEAWSKNDPEAALEWAFHHGQKGKVNPLYVQALGAIAIVNLPLATAELEKHADDPELVQALGHVVAPIAHQGHEAIQTWVDSFSSDTLRDRAVHAVIGSLGPDVNEERLFWLEHYPRMILPEDMSGQYSFYIEWHTEEALNHYAKMPDGPLKEQALKGMTGNIASRYPDRGLTFMDRFPETVTDEVVSHWMMGASTKDPALALGQLNRFSNDEAREQAEGSVLDKWFTSDPDAMKAWLEKNEVPQGLKVRFEDR